MYFNYHAKIKKLIQEHHLIGYKFMDKYNKISPALVLLFDCHPPMPIRQHRWQEYKIFLATYGTDLQIPKD